MVARISGNLENAPGQASPQSRAYSSAVSSHGSTAVARASAAGNGESSSNAVSEAVSEGGKDAEATADVDAFASEGRNTSANASLNVFSSGGVSKGRVAAVAEVRGTDPYGKIYYSDGMGYAWGGL